MKKFLGILLVVATVVVQIHMEPVRVCAAEPDPLVIVLDAGHGGHDGGATRTWGKKKYLEKNLNLAIAKYCKQELEKYVGVRVYLTRADDTYVTLDDRVSYARRVGADLFVSLHNNADYSSARNGACVFYPNFNYDRPLAVEGRMIAQNIQAQLVSLGIRNLGVTYRNSSSRTRYPDGKLADYYSVIRGSKLCGFTGLIVEHAFVSNSSDCKKYLGTEAKLKKLGVADATGIANAFGLVKGGMPTLRSAENQADGSIMLTWTKSKGADGYAVFRRTAGSADETLVGIVEGSASTTYTDTMTVGGTSYEYLVRAFVTREDVTRYTLADCALAVTALAAPEQALLSRTSDGTLLSWLPSEGAVGYLVSRRANADEAYTVVAELKNAENQWLDEDGGVQYSYEYMVCSYVEKDGLRILSKYALATSSMDADR